MLIVHLLVGLVAGLVAGVSLVWLDFSWWSTALAVVAAGNAGVAVSAVAVALAVRPRAGLSGKDPLVISSRPAKG